MLKHTVSIITPCFNDGKYLSESVASARSQTWNYKELIIIDDNSTDEATRSLLRELSNQPDIRILSVPAGRKGPSAARNVGIEAAQGEFILPLDADDKIGSTYLEKAVQRMEADASLALCYCKARFFGLKAGLWKLPAYTWQTMMCGNVIFPTAMYRKKDWERAGGYDESLIDGLEDYAFWLHLLSPGRPVACIDEVLFHYRIKPNSRSAQMIRDKQQAAQDALFRSCQDIFTSNARLLVEGVRQLQHERDVKNCLLTWRLFAPLAKVEWALRQMIKKIMGRA
jgi:glycosyltransferase involved in cell wall biosynthesis